MKRKTMVLLAVTPLIFGLIVAKRLADKRPRLVARLTTQLPSPKGSTRWTHAIALFVSPDGRHLFARDGYGFGQHIDLSAGSPIAFPLVVPITDISYGVWFSPDNQSIYMVSGYKPKGTGGQESAWHRSIVARDARSGKLKRQFVLPLRIQLNGNPFYGLRVSGDQTVVESRGKTWRLDANMLQLIGTQARQRPLTWVQLCPDGQTGYRFLAVAQSSGMEFFDLQSGRSLWKTARLARYPAPFSADGRLVLTQENGVIFARETRTGKEQWRFQGPQSDVLALAPDQSAIYEARTNGQLWKWPR